MFGFVSKREWQRLSDENVELKTRIVELKEQSAAAIRRLEAELRRMPVEQERLVKILVEGSRHAITDLLRAVDLRPAIEAAIAIRVDEIVRNINVAGHPLGQFVTREVDERFRAKPPV